MNDIIDLELLRQLILGQPEHKWPHANTCPEVQQSYWRMRGEYRQEGYGPDKPCTCGLRSALGLPE